MIEQRSIPLELRAEGRKLSGVVIRYSDYSPTHQERFLPGAFRLAETVPLNLEHDELRAAAWYPGGGLSLEDDENELRFEAELPTIPAGDLALDLVKSGKAKGLSIEFRAHKERRDNGIRIVESALLIGVGLVRNPSYPQSQVEARNARQIDLWRLL